MRPVSTMSTRILSTLCAGSTITGRLQDVLIIFLLSGFTAHVAAQQRTLLSNSRLVFGSAGELSASVRAGDLDNDGDLDLIVANGRHWPQQNFILLNDGAARFTVVRPLGSDQCTSYAAEPVDIDGDGDLDIVTGNDQAPCNVFVNNGQAHFTLSTPLNGISSVRSLTIADLNGDEHPDVIATSRGMTNLAHINDGTGNFPQLVQCGADNDSTIDLAAADLNHDGMLDLVLANRDSQLNQILLQTDLLHFKPTSLGTVSLQTRAIAVADMNGDGHMDCVTGNIESPNEVYFGDGTGLFPERITFGSADRQTYSVAIADMDNDGDPDIVTGVVGSQNVVYFNTGDGRSFSENTFGEPDTATYGLCIADFDGDGFADVAVANSGAQNRIFLNRPAAPARPQRQPAAAAIQPAAAAATSATTPSTTQTRPAPAETRSLRTSDPGSDWPWFRGSGHLGVADGCPLPATWNADPEDEIADSNILWQTPIPGLSHSSPVIVGDLALICTVIAADGEAPLAVGRSGAADAADDNGVQKWMVLCLNRHTGEQVWERTCRVGLPQVTRHAKATHANTTLTVTNERIYAFFGSEGLYCLNMDGTLHWERDLGVINISKYGIGWGYASSPAIFEDKLVLVCDDPERPFLVTLDAGNGEELYRISREGETERNWSTPFIIRNDIDDDPQVVVNGWPSVISYNLSDGSERWRIRGGGDNPVPTPFAINQHIYITSAHGASAPIHAVRLNAKGDLTELTESAPNDGILWSIPRGGAYMSTPVVYEGLLYVGSSNGVLRCYDAMTGEQLYEERLGSGASIIASLVAGDGKIFAASENGNVYVISAGQRYELLSVNPMGAPCYATPAISSGVIYIRTTNALIAACVPPASGGLRSP